MLHTDITKKDIKVVLKPSEIMVSIKGETLFGGKLWNVLDSDSMTWTIQKNGKLEITFCKANIGMIWQRFLKQQNETEIIDGEEVMDPNMVEQIHSQFTTKSADVIEHSEQTKSIESNIANMELNKIYNSQELDACDDVPEEENKLYLIPGSEGGKASHYTSLSGRQWICNVDVTKDRVGEAPKFCLR